jgi:nucleotide-binding universal stress UspA family protein
MACHAGAFAVIIAVMTSGTPGPIIVPLDGSALAEIAVPVAAALARRAGAGLRLVHVHSGTSAEPIYVEGLPVIDDELHPLHRRHAQVYLERLRDRLADANTAIAVLEGGVPEAILADARRHASPLLVMATHGRGGFERLWLGSVAQAVVSGGSTPVLLVRPGTEEAVARLRRILVPLDGSPVAEAALAPAAWLAAGHPGCELTLVRVVTGSETTEPAPEKYLEDVASRLGGGTSVRSRVVRAQGVARALIEAAATDEADLVALATHGRTGLSRLTLGSVADKLLRACPSSVLVVRPG